MNNPQTKITTEHGTFTVASWDDENSQCLLLWTEGVEVLEAPLVRLHSSCLFSESFGSNDCDCNLQLKESLRLLSKEGGVVAYLYQEGRGHGIEKKIQAMEIERVKNVDTYDAFTHLGLDIDPRNYSVAIRALTDLGISKKIRLISNNPRKRAQLEDAGFEIIDRVELELSVSPEIKKYLQAKKDRLGHDIDMTKFAD